MKFSKSAFCFFAAITAALFSNLARADFPENPVKIIVAASPGGTSDVIARVLSEKLTTELGKPTIVDYKSGANGTIATTYVARSAPDGYTILLVTPGFAVNNAFNPNSPYDPIKDFSVIGTIGETPMVLLVSRNSPYRNLRQFVAAGKTASAKFTYGSGGVGSSNQLSAELLKSLTGIKADHIPYRGDIQVVTDLMGGQIT